MYIVKPTEDEAVQILIKKFEDLIVANGGTVEKKDCWGKKRLAYEIQKIREGIYVLVNFSANAACVAELDRVMRITDDLLRHMIVKKDDKKGKKEEDE